jgi:purine nucleoside phosphorylase
MDFVRVDIFLFGIFSYLANLLDFKQLGVDVVLATTAVGSLAEDFPRGTLVVFGID